MYIERVSTTDILITMNQKVQSYNFVPEPIIHVPTSIYCDNIIKLASGIFFQIAPRLLHLIH